MLLLQSIIGLIILITLSWSLSEDRKILQVKSITIGLFLQFILAILLLKVPFIHTFFIILNDIVMSLERATKAGTSFVFGYIGGGALPFKESFPGSSFILALQALPLVLVVSALSALLFYWRILPYIVKAFSSIFEKTMSIGGALGLGASANIFVGMVESPLFIRPYLKEMTRSELFAIMTCGMATIAGTVMVLYASILKSAIPDAMGHILTASLISAPAALTIARVLVPETGRPTSGALIPPQPASSAMDAITKGTFEGLQLLLNITAMLIVLVALVSMANQILSILPEMGGSEITLQRLLGYLFSPIVWLIGVPWQEARTAGSLMGTKTILNEFLAYLEMSKLPAGQLSERSQLIMTYAMCGFANLGSLGIMIGGLGTMAPERRNEIVSLGFKSILAGTLATCMTGAVVGIIGY